MMLKDDAIKENMRNLDSRIELVEAKQVCLIYMFYKMRLCKRKKLSHAFLFSFYTMTGNFALSYF